MSFANRGLFSPPAFLGQVQVRSASLGKVYSGEVSWVGENICKLLEIWSSGIDDPREREMVEQEFDRWYGKISYIDWKEAELTEYIRQFCPKGALAFNQMRADWEQRRNLQRKINKYSGGTPFVPPGDPVPSVDPRRPDPDAAIRRILYPPVPTEDPNAAIRRILYPTAPPQAQTTTPSIPTGSSSSSTSSYQEGFSADCPPGQFRAYPGGPCRGAVATGGLPGLPGGFGMTSAMPGTLAPSGVTMTTYAGMGTRFPVMNLEGRG